MTWFIQQTNAFDKIKPETENHSEKKPEKIEQYVHIDLSSEDGLTEISDSVRKLNQYQRRALLLEIRRVDNFHKKYFIEQTPNAIINSKCLIINLINSGTENNENSLFEKISNFFTTYIESNLPSYLNNLKNKLPLYVSNNDIIDALKNSDDDFKSSINKLSADVLDGTYYETITNNTKNAIETHSMLIESNERSSKQLKEIHNSIAKNHKIMIDLSTSEHERFLAIQNINFSLDSYAELIFNDGLTLSSYSKDHFNTIVREVNKSYKIIFDSKDKTKSNISLCMTLELSRGLVVNTLNELASERNKENRLLRSIKSGETEFLKSMKKQTVDSETINVINDTNEEEAIEVIIDIGRQPKNAATTTVNKAENIQPIISNDIHNQIRAKSKEAIKLLDEAIEDGSFLDDNAGSIIMLNKEINELIETYSKDIDNLDCKGLYKSDFDKLIKINNNITSYVKQGHISYFKETCLMHYISSFIDQMQYIKNVRMKNKEKLESNVNNKHNDSAGNITIKHKETDINKFIKSIDEEYNLNDSDAGINQFSINEKNNQLNEFSKKKHSENELKEKRKTMEILVENGMTPSDKLVSELATKENELKEKHKPMEILIGNGKTPSDELVSELATKAPTSQNTNNSTPTTTKKLLTEPEKTIENIIKSNMFAEELATNPVILKPVPERNPVIEKEDLFEKVNQDLLFKKATIRRIKGYKLEENEAKAKNEKHDNLVLNNSREMLDFIEEECKEFNETETALAVYLNEFGQKSSTLGKGDRGAGNGDLSRLHELIDDTLTIVTEKINTVTVSEKNKEAMNNIFDASLKNALVNLQAIIDEMNSSLESVEKGTESEKAQGAIEKATTLSNSIRDLILKRFVLKEELEQFNKEQAIKREELYKQLDNEKNSTQRNQDESDDHYNGRLLLSWLTPLNDFEFFEGDTYSEWTDSTTFSSKINTLIQLEDSILEIAKKSNGKDCVKDKFKESVNKAIDKINSVFAILNNSKFINKYTPLNNLPETFGKNLELLKGIQSRLNT